MPCRQGCRLVQERQPAYDPVVMHPATHHLFWGVVHDAPMAHEQPVSLRSDDPPKGGTRCYSPSPRPGVGQGTVSHTQALVSRCDSAFFPSSCQAGPLYRDIPVTAGAQALFVGVNIDARQRVAWLRIRLRIAQADLAQDIIPGD